MRTFFRALLCVQAAMAWLRLVEIEDPSSFSALMYLPPNAQARAEPWPLLLYLHGAGESGRDVGELISEGATGTPPVALEKGAAIDTLARDFVVARAGAAILDGRQRET